MLSTTRKRAAVTALLSLFVFALSSNALPAVLLRAADGLCVSMNVLAQVAAVQFAGFVVASILGGIWADHVGKKLVLQVACGLMCVGALVWSFAGGFRMACIGGLLMGLGGGVMESMSSAALSDMFPDRRRFFLNLSQVMYCLGALLGPVIMSWLLPLGVSWRLCFAGIAMASAVLLLLYGRTTLPAPNRGEEFRLSALTPIFRRRTFLLPCLALFLYVLVEAAIIVYGNAYLQMVHGAPERWAIAFLSFFWGGMLLGRLACSLIPERISYVKIIVPLLVVSAVPLALQQWAGDWRDSLILLVLTGTLLSGVWPLIVGMSASINYGYSGAVLGATIAVGALGCVVAPSVVNVLWVINGAEHVFSAIALPLLFAALALLACGR